MKTLHEDEGSPAGESVVKPDEPKMRSGLKNAQLDGGQAGNSGPYSAKALKRFVNAAPFVTAALSVLLTLGVVAWSAHKPALVIQGEVHATEVHVAPMVLGRVQALHVCQGDKVRKGQLLVALENQELQARLEQARAEMELAKDRNRIVQTACVEYIGAQSNWWVKAKALAEHAEQTVNRSRALQAAEVISLQELQDLERDLDLARSSEGAAKAGLDLAMTLFRDEGQLPTAANLEQATRTFAELEALVAELALTSPMDGDVQDLIVGQGELATPGVPLMSIVAPQDIWVKFNLPEDLLSDVRMGTNLRVRVPALGNQEVPVKVNYISSNRGVPIRSAADGTAGFDRRTFEVRAVPVQTNATLRSGMNVLLTWPKFD